MKWYTVVDIDRPENSCIVKEWNKVTKLLKKNKDKFIFKSFYSLKEAEKFKTTSQCKILKPDILKNIEVECVFFDAGNFFNGSFECRVTDYRSDSVLDFIITNERSNFTFLNSTVNTAELIGCGLALKYALKNKKKYILGDSMIVLFYWLEDYYKVDSKETENLIQNIILLYKKFLAQNGKVFFIRRELNKADLKLQYILKK